MQPLPKKTFKVYSECQKVKEASNLANERATKHAFEDPQILMRVGRSEKLPSEASLVLEAEDVLAQVLREGRHDDIDIVLV